MPMDHAEKAVVICDSKGRWPACVYQAGQRPFYRAPGMGNNLVVKVHYRLGSRNC